MDLKKIDFQLKIEGSEQTEHTEARATPSGRSRRMPVCSHKNFGLENFGLESFRTSHKAAQHGRRPQSTFHPGANDGRSLSVLNCAMDNLQLQD